MFRRSTHDTSFGRIVGIVLTCVAFACAGPAGAQSAQQQANTLGSDPDAPIQVGVYDPKIAFEAHPSEEAVSKAMITAQAQMQKAQQSGDAQWMQDIQQQFEHKRLQALDEFRQSVTELFPTVAKVAGVHIGAMQVSYTSERVGVRDLTSKLVEAITNGLKVTPSEKTDTALIPITLGTYTPETIFEAHPAYAQMMNKTNTLDVEIQQAQRSGDQQTLQFLVEEQKQARRSALEQFQKDMATLVPNVANSAGVDLTALEVVYAVGGVITKDITTDLVDAIKRSEQ